MSNYEKYFLNRNSPNPNKKSAVETSDEHTSWLKTCDYWFRRFGNGNFDIVEKVIRLNGALKEKWALNIQTWFCNMITLDHMLQNPWKPIWKRFVKPHLFYSVDIPPYPVFTSIFLSFVEIKTFGFGWRHIIQMLVEMREKFVASAR